MDVYTLRLSCIMEALVLRTSIARHSIIHFVLELSGVAPKKPRTGRIEGRRVVKLLNDTSYFLPFLHNLNFLEIINLSL